MRQAIVYVAAAILFSSIFSLPPATVQSEEILVGVSTPLSGAAAPPGQGVLRAIELGVDEINSQGGIKIGKDRIPIKLIIYDSKYDVREAVAITNKLIYYDRVKYIFTFGGTCVVAVNPLVTESKILHLAYAYGGRQATNPSVPYTFRAMMEPIQMHMTLLPWIAKKYNLKTIALTSTDDETGLAQAEDAEYVAKKLGLTITDKAFAPRGTADFTPMLTRLVAKKPEAIDFGSWSGSDGPLICKQAKELGYKGFFIFSYTQSIPTFQKVAGDFMDGVLFYGVFATDPTSWASKVAKQYEEKYKQRFDPYVWRNHVGLFVLRKAIENAGTLDTESIKNAMPKAKIESVCGPATVGGKSYYGYDCQVLFPASLSTYDAKQKKLVELYRGTVPADY
jgi:branched-chain amino acid transport system substrate-binding protein